MEYEVTLNGKILKNVEASSSMDDWLGGLPTEGLHGWLPVAVDRRRWLPATPRRIAWAIREITYSGYPGRVLAARIRGSETLDPGADTLRSLLAVESRRYRPV